MRGGTSYIVKRNSKANNKHIQSHDSSNENKYITYQNESNLYGWAMSQYWPYGRFKCLNWGIVDNFDVNSINENNSDGYILEVYLEYSVSSMIIIR